MGVVKGEGGRGKEKQTMAVEQGSRTKTRQPRAGPRPVIDLFVRCPKCRHAQHEYGYSLSDRPWFKCEDCNQVIPSGAWYVITIGNKAK